ncbi:MAG: hypothetical protein F4123_08550 [Gemmatimonadetes bacterium]|nr:hypothetical protein [Gemmatimonadota bacterium]MYB99695.1 hypothetical protein [Gemmatimonadota bacterium]MYI46403.1 hypothetical protein [Gemmatimonadota bacterium]
MTYDSFLVCLNKGGDEVVRAAKELWPDNGHIHITGEAISGPLPQGTAHVFAIAVERDNGPTLSTDIYAQLKERTGGDFTSIIVPLEGQMPVYGWNSRALWEWLRKVTG